MTFEIRVRYNQQRPERHVLMYAFATEEEREEELKLLRERHPAYTFIRAEWPHSGKSPIVNLHGVV